MKPKPGGRALCRPRCSRLYHSLDVCPARLAARRRPARRVPGTALWYRRIIHPVTPRGRPLDCLKSARSRGYSSSRPPTTPVTEGSPGTPALAAGSGVLVDILRTVSGSRWKRFLIGPFTVFRGRGRGRCCHLPRPRAVHHWSDRSEAARDSVGHRRPRGLPARGEEPDMGSRRRRRCVRPAGRRPSPSGDPVGGFDPCRVGGPSPWQRCDRHASRTQTGCRPARPEPQGASTSAT